MARRQRRQRTPGSAAPESLSNSNRTACRPPARGLRDSPPRRAARRHDKRSGAWRAQSISQSAGSFFLEPAGVIGRPSSSYSGGFSTGASTPRRVTGVLTAPASSREPPGGGSSPPRRPQAESGRANASAPITTGRNDERLGRDKAGSDISRSIPDCVSFARLDRVASIIGVSAPLARQFLQPLLRL